jgi:hypothetical protein
VAWIARHCIKVPAPPNTPGSGLIVPIGIFYCATPR